jgi:hypothetical protein
MKFSDITIVGWCWIIYFGGMAGAIGWGLLA